MPTLLRDGMSFHYRDGGGPGIPFVFQHGLGSSLAIPLGIYTPPAGVRFVGMDFRAHGETRPVGDVKKIAIATYADDLVALLDHLAIDRAVVGGISLGGAVAMNLALRYPDRVRGLVIVRPAWIDLPHPQNARVFSHIAQYLLKYGAAEGRARFIVSDEYRAIEQSEPELAKVLVDEFLEPRAEECVARLERLPHDRPCRDREELRAIDAPTLVVGQERDPVHPWEIAESLARLIPGAVLRRITPRGVDLVAHIEELQAAIDGFFEARILNAPETA